MRRILFIITGLGSLLLFAWCVRTLGTTTEGPPRLRYDLEPGERLSYQLEYSGEHAIITPGAEDLSAGPGLQSGTKLDAAIVVDVLAERNDHWVLQWKVGRVDDAALSLGGTEVVGGGEANEMFDGRSVIIEMAFDGTVQEVLVDPADPEAFHNVAKFVIAHTQFVVPRSSRRSWSVRESAGLGQALTLLELDEWNEEESVARKTERNYASFLALPWVDELSALEQDNNGETIVEFSGSVTHLEAEESVEVLDGDRTLLSASVELTWDLTSRDRVTTRPNIERDFASLRRDRLDAVAESELAEANALRQQAGDATLGSVESYIRGFDEARFLSEDHGLFMWNATGLLLMDPALCDELVPVFGDASTTEMGRYLISDLLAATGHTRAQSALRTILDTDAARSDDAVHSRLLQRLGQLENPDSATAEFALERYRTLEREHESIASELVLGSLARQLPAGSPQQTALYDELAGDLDNAKEPSQQRRLLRALSNAAQPQNTEIAKRYVDSPASGVRSAAALAVFRVETPDAQALLGALSGDESESVQLTALHALTEHETNANTQAMLSEQINSGRLRPSNYSAALQVLKTFPASADRAATVRHMLKQTAGDPRLASQLRALETEHAS